MSKSKGSLKVNFRVLFWIVVLALAIYFVARNITVFGNIIKVIIGFGVVILVHEFGHFIVAKLSGIKIEAFSIGFPPVLAGILRTEKGYRIRLLPSFFKGKDEENTDGGLTFCIGKKAKAGETEYRIGMIPFGGFVKMLGQEDIGIVADNDDPRSYANKPVGIRMAVITAGVFFNALSAVILFMTAFLIGIKLPPAVVGAVIPDSPAARAGLRAGDEVIEINGKSKELDFSNISIAAALSDWAEEIPVKVRRQDGSVKEFHLVAEQIPGSRMKLFGIVPPLSLEIAEVSDANALFEKTGLLASDRIKSANGQDVQSYWQLKEIIENAFAPVLSVLAERTEPVSKEIELVETEIPLGLNFADSYEIDSESGLCHICSMVPRLRIDMVVPKPSSGFLERSVSFFNHILGKEAVDIEPRLRVGDIILAVGSVENPTYEEVRHTIAEYEDKKLSVKVLRTRADGGEEITTVSVTPRRPAGAHRPMIGVGFVLDAERPVIARTVDGKNGMAKLPIPRGAVITAVNGTAVTDFYEIIKQIRQTTSRSVKIDYTSDGGATGSVSANAELAKDSITVKSVFAEFVPFAALKAVYKADGPVNAIVMGYRKTIMFIAQTYATLKSLFTTPGLAKELFGPVGIIHLSYRVVSGQPAIYHVYLIGLISACIAVFNFLPLPPLDGGHIVFLLIEKLKGSALSARIQGAMIYTGWILIGSLFLYVTFNDFARIVKSLFF